MCHPPVYNSMQSAFASLSCESAWARISIIASCNAPPVYLEQQASWASMVSILMGVHMWKLFVLLVAVCCYHAVSSMCRWVAAIGAPAAAVAHSTGTSAEVLCSYFTTCSGRGGITFSQQADNIASACRACTCTRTRPESPSITPQL